MMKTRVAHALWSVHKSVERDAEGFPTTRSSTLNNPENLSKQPGPPLGDGCHCNVIGPVIATSLDQSLALR